VRRSREANPGKQQEAEAEWRDRQRTAVFDRYGRVCACCGATDDLTIDHMDGDGAEHRAELFKDGRMAGWHFYAWLVRNGLPDGYQTLCRPCNNSKWTGERCRLDHGSAA
jgi:hypothetical protein